MGAAEAEEEEEKKRPEELVYRGGRRVAASLRRRHNSLLCQRLVGQIIVQFAVGALNGAEHATTCSAGGAKGASSWLREAGAQTRVAEKSWKGERKLGSQEEPIKERDLQRAGRFSKLICARVVFPFVSPVRSSRPRWHIGANLLLFSFASSSLSAHQPAGRRLEKLQEAAPICKRPVALAGPPIH